MRKRCGISPSKRQLKLRSISCTGLGFFQAQTGEACSLAAASSAMRPLANTFPEFVPRRSVRRDTNARSLRDFVEYGVVLSAREIDAPRSFDGYGVSVPEKDVGFTGRRKSTLQSRELRFNPPPSDPESSASCLSPTYVPEGRCPLQ